MSYSSSLIKADGAEPTFVGKSLFVLSKNEWWRLINLGRELFDRSLQNQKRSAFLYGSVSIIGNAFPNHGKDIRSNRMLTHLILEVLVSFIIRFFIVVPLTPNNLPTAS